MSRFFGFGSLVNLHTHDYVDPKPMTVTGWKRQWVSSTLRDVAFLSVTPCADTTLQGMSASTVGIGWAALDVREQGYNRHPLPDTDMQIYIGSPDCILLDVKQPILLSYLDVVVQGYHTHFGSQGVADFFATTQNWDHPILNDRAAPQYPRAQTLTDQERTLVDSHLDAL
tara:strand:+ start:2933 stop:3442 length:510 start_codon:yes stop_codon:yes gene_type:complete